MFCAERDVGSSAVVCSRLFCVLQRQWGDAVNFTGSEVDLSIHDVVKYKRKKLRKTMLLGCITMCGSYLSKQRKIHGIASGI